MNMRSCLSASIWQKNSRQRAQIVRKVCKKLEGTYGNPRYGNPSDPLEDLIYIVLSNKTSLEVACRVFNNLKERFPTWDDILKHDVEVLRGILVPAGLSFVKSKHIYATLQKIAADFGSCSLERLRDRNEADTMSYLVSLPGVSEKVAKCVMMYTLGFEVLPVDVHVHRIARRLGWTNRKRADQCHAELEALIPAERRFAFHVDCIAHGRTICRATNPQCERCVVNTFCEYYLNEREPRQVKI